MQCPQIVSRNARLDLAAYWKAKGLEKGLEMEKEQSTMFRFRWICPEFSELKPNFDGGFVGEKHRVWVLSSTCIRECVT